MKRLLRRGATLVAATMTAALLLPGAAAQAVPPNITPCDNETTTTAQEFAIPVLNIGTVIVHVDTSQDIFVLFDGPGEPLDTEVGTDVQIINAIGDHDTVCILLPGIGGIEVAVDLLTLHVEVCTFSGQPWALTGCLVNT